MGIGSVAQHITRHLELYFLASLILGVVVGYGRNLAWLKSLVPLALFLMLYPMMVNLDIGKVKGVVRSGRIVMAALVLNFVVSPLVMAALVHAFGFSGELAAGLLLIGMTPCAGMVIAFTGLSKGNVEAAVVLVAVSLLAAVVLVPLWSSVLIGMFLPVPTQLIAKTIFVVIVLPLVGGDITRRLIIKRRGFEGYVAMKESFSAFASFGLLLIFFIIFSINSTAILATPWIVVKLAVPSALFYVLMLGVAWGAGRLVGMGWGDNVALCFSTAAKNQSIAIALALVAFGHTAALAVAVGGPLIQAPIMLSYVRYNKSHHPAKGVQCGA